MPDPLFTQYPPLPAGAIPGAGGPGGPVDPGLTQGPGTMPPPGAGAVARGRFGAYPALPGGDAGGGGTRVSDFQRGWQSTPGGGFTPSAQGASNPAATTAQPMSDPASDYARLFGTTTPQDRVAKGLPTTGPLVPPPPMQPQAPGGVPPNGGGADNAPKEPKATPQQAGDNNSLMPGWSNGQPLVGAPKETGGGVDTKTLAATAAPSPVNYPPLPTTPAAPAQTPAAPAAAATAAPTSTREPGAPVAPTTTTPVATGAAAGQTTTMTGEPAAPPSAAGLPAVPQKSAAAAPATTPKTVNFSGVTYTLNNPANRLPQDWAALTAAQKSAWLAKNSTSSSTASSAADAVNAFKQYTNLVLPDTVPTGAGGNIDVGQTQQDINKITGGNATLNRLALDAQSILRATSGPSGAGQGKLDAKTLDRYNAVVKALASYGITIGAAPTTTPGTGDTGNTGDQNGGGNQGGGNQNGGGNIPGQGSGGQPANPNSNLDLATGTGGRTFTDYVTLFSRSYGPDRAIEMAKSAIAADQQANLDTNRQNAVNLVGGALGNMEKSDLFTGPQTLAKSILANPDPTDWDAIRSRKIADAQAAGQAALRDMGSAAARRLGSGGVGAVSAEAADVQRQANRQLSNDLGDLSIQKSILGRQNQIQAIQTALGVLSGTTGAEIGDIYSLANLITGNPADYQNAWADVPNFFQTQNQVENIQNASQPRTINDILAPINAAAGAAQAGAQVATAAKK